jgi:ribonucleases P/MRP protein subunit RPP40
MRFNVSKCKVMHVGRNNPKAGYKMGGTELSSTKEKDRGVAITDTLKPAVQCAKAAKLHWQC